MSAFDEYAVRYEEALNAGLSVSGESAAFFAEQRIEYLRQMLDRLGFSPRRVLDFGCGTGGALPHFLELEGATISATDPSAKSLEQARRRHAGEPIEWIPWSDIESTRDFDLVFTNGVFHHVALDARESVARIIRDRLRSGGLFAFWENNPWSPAARYVMSRIPFDRDARLVWPAAARRFLRRAGFAPFRTDFQFIFPRVMSVLRPLETVVSRLPLGAQYQILSRAV